LRNNNPQGNDILGNTAQLEAIRHDKGPAMVLAGPGSGKTFVITQRLKYLIEVCGADPSSILVITFTKAAALEMQHRFMKLTDSSYPEVSFGTFHSVFYQILRNSRSKTTPTISLATEKQKHEFLKDALSFLREKKKLGEEEYLNCLQEIPDILSEISRYKNTCNDFSSFVTNISAGPLFPDIYKGYNKLLSEFGLIDFDDMIIRCYELLMNNRSILSSWQERFDYFLIDEYQDINLMQFKVVELLCRDLNLFVVGDDDQSIYGFRGSDPGIMMAFKKTFERGDPRLINLDVNYRCGRVILENAIKVIEENKVRFKKKLTANAGNGCGLVAARRYESRDRQNEAIALFLLHHLNELSDIAILFRSNTERSNLARLLTERGIPHNLEDSTPGIFKNEGVLLCVSYLEFAYNGQKRCDYLKIINRPMRYISRDSCSRETVSQREVLEYYKGNRARSEAAERFFRNIDMLRHLRPVLAVRFIRNSIGIDSLYSDKEALKSFEKLSQDYTDMEMFLTFCREEIQKESTEKKTLKGQNNGNRVKLMTLHGSKGLEFKTVWLPDLNEGIIPSRNATTSQQIEEERRMLYVGMTRAKQALIMSYVTGSKDNPMLPTRFLRPVRDLWEDAYQRPSESSSGASSGRSTSSSNSASSR
jgi:DNA helicase-2/ATP-dependent DNA helicase PcrA